MKKMKLLFLLVVIIASSSCKKEWVCECTHSNGSYIAGYLDDTKRKASKSCDELSKGDTKCVIK